MAERRFTCLLVFSHIPKLSGFFFFRFRQCLTCSRDYDGMHHCSRTCNEREWNGRFLFEQDLVLMLLTRLSNTSLPDYYNNDRMCFHAVHTTHAHAHTCALCTHTLPWYGSPYRCCSYIKNSDHPLGLYWAVNPPGVKRLGYGFPHTCQTVVIDLCH